MKNTKTSATVKIAPPIQAILARMSDSPVIAALRWLITPRTIEATHPSVQGKNHRAMPTIANVLAAFEGGDETPSAAGAPDG